MKVLIADDEMVSRLLVQAAVDGLGHESVVAADGTAAWHLYLEHQPQVVISDWLMPGMDGLELCRRIRAHEGAGYAYLMLATVRRERDDVMKGMEAGADDYLVKPLDPFDLHTRLVAARRVTALHSQLDKYRQELERANDELAHVARTDALTRLRNRLALQEDLEMLHARSQRYGRSYCVAMCDVDNFKSYNDTRGHQAGDEALEAVGETLATHVRLGDGVYRYGGEEFLVVLPEQDLESGVAAAERLRRAVEALGIRHPGSDGVITVSCGVTGFDGDRVVSTDALLKEADAALYHAKSAGRNRVATHDGGD